ncbi:MAG: Hpt domain-containing protein [Opitutaceae bacterium]|jgi:HPt (histidine-containing phosphotransfer) domain-containing protein
MSPSQKNPVVVPPAKPLKFGCSNGRLVAEVLDDKHMTQLRALHVEGKNSLFYELSVIFRREATPRISILHQAVAARDAAEVARLAHAFVGSTASIGARQMQCAMKAVELAAISSEWTKVEEILVYIDSAWARLLAALERCDREEGM